MEMSQKKIKKIVKRNSPTNRSTLPTAVYNSNAPSNTLESSSGRALTVPNAPSDALGLIREDGNNDFYKAMMKFL